MLSFPIIIIIVTFIYLLIYLLLLKPASGPHPKSWPKLSKILAEAKHEYNRAFFSSLSQRKLSLHGTLFSTSAYHIPNSLGLKCLLHFSTALPQIPTKKM